MSLPSLHKSKEIIHLVDDNEQTNPFVKVIKLCSIWNKRTAMMVLLFHQRGVLVRIDDGS
jgi:hypothetical protein